MATNIILKKSSITGRVPNDSALAYGELAINYTDGKLYYKHSSQTVRSFLDENQIITLIDSDYVAARSPAGGGGGTDSAQVIGIIEDTIDSDYIVARLGTVGSPLVVFNYEADSGQSTFTGSDVNGQTLSYQAEDLLVFLNGILLVDSDDYTASNGSSIELFVPADSGDTVTIAAFNIRLSAGLDSADVTTLIDSDYINSRVTATAGTDSAQVISLITDTVDSAYIQARQVDIYRDSAFVTNIIDSDYIAARTSAGTDSATVVSIVTDTVDSAYVAARTPAVDFTGYATESYVTTQINNLVDGAPDALNTLNELAAALNDDSDAYNSLLSLIGGKLDSAGVTNLVDSAYVQARVTIEAGTDSATVISLITDTVDSAYIGNRVSIDSDLLLSTLGVGKSPLVTYQFTADSGQLTFTGLDDNSRTLTYTETENLLVFVNGVLLATDDYTATNGTSIVLDIAADSADTVTIARFNILDAIQSVSPIDKFVYTADSGQTVFTGADDNSNTLNYSQEKLLVYLNGVLLVDSADYTATSGNSVVLTSPSAVDDVVTVTTFNLARGAGLDSTAVTNLVDSAYVAARVTVGGGTDSATVVSLISDTVDSAYIQARQADIYRDSAFVTSIIDSDYINARVTATAGTDSAQVVSLITDTVDSAYIQARQITYTVLDSADVSGIVEAYGYLTTAIDSATVISLIDSDYINARVTATAGTDSATVVAIINNTIDSSFVSSIVDSAFISGVVDSGYITDRLGVVGSPLVVFNYEADSGQTVFSGSDLSGRTLAYNNSEDLLVYLNGVLLVDSDDYYATDGSSVNLYTGADSGNTLTIAQFNIRLSTGLDSNEILNLIQANIDATVNEFKFVATNGQTTFTGSDYNSNTLLYAPSSIQVYMNGVRLVDSDDYTATNGTSVVLTSAASTGDQIVVTNIKGAGAAVDLSAVDQHIIPAADSAYDLGSPTNKFRSLYLSGNTLYLGSLQLKDSDGGLAIVDSSGSSVSVGGAGGYVTSYGLDGTLQVFNGSQRKYIHDTFTLATVDAYLVTGPSGSAATVRINKNGTSIGTITIADGTTKTENTVFGTGFIKGDYITVDITAVGSTTPGTDLYLNFIFS